MAARSIRGAGRPLPLCGFTVAGPAGHVADLVAVAAARLVALGGADEDGRVAPRGGPAVDEPLGTAGLRAALLADGVELDHIVCQSQKPGHESERQPSEILIQSCCQHIYP